GPDERAGSERRPGAGEPQSDRLLDPRWLHRGRHWSGRARAGTGDDRRRPGEPEGGDRRVEAPEDERSEGPCLEAPGRAVTEPIDRKAPVYAVRDEGCRRID